MATTSSLVKTAKIATASSAADQILDKLKGNWIVDNGKLGDVEDAKPGDYQKSAEVKSAESKLSAAEAAKPKDYSSAYAADIARLYDEVMNRPAFQYDVNADPLYEQYRTQYTRQGRDAMLDTMGEASALTGGYGSSYAATAGNQAYQSYLSQLNDIVPELYSAAYERYGREGESLLEQMGLARGLDSDAYARHRDNVGDYQNERDYYAQRADTLNDRDYGQYSDRYGWWQDDRDYYWDKRQDDRDRSQWSIENEQEQEQWRKEYENKQKQQQQEQERWQKRYELDLSKRWW